MPLYSFKCPKCKEEKDYFIDINDSEVPFCETCLIKREKQLSKIRVVQKDSNYEKSRKNVEKFVEDSRQDLKNVMQELKGKRK